jgi:hypothetical protein
LVLRSPPFGKNTPKVCKMGDFQNYTLSTTQRESEVKVVLKRDGKTSSWKIVEEYRINNLVNSSGRR